MTHRAHRPPATIPARRGMRASWFRGRALHELGNGADVPEPSDPGAAVETDDACPSDDPVATPPAPATATTLPASRPGFGHPTF